MSEDKLPWEYTRFQLGQIAQELDINFAEDYIHGYFESFEILELDLDTGRIVVLDDGEYLDSRLQAGPPADWYLVEAIESHEDGMAAHLRINQ